MQLFIIMLVRVEEAVIYYVGEGCKNWREVEGFFFQTSFF